MAKPKEKKVKTRTIWVPLEVDAAAKLANEATEQKRSVGSHAALIIEDYYAGKLVRASAVPA